MRWLDRRIGREGPYLALCLSEAEFKGAVRHLGVAAGAWLNPHAHATMHSFYSSKGLCCIVCLGSTEGRNGVEIAGLLIHEAVHIWQQWCDDIGESRPGSEQEAYAIQAIAQELLAEYARRLFLGGLKMTWHHPRWPNPWNLSPQQERIVHLYSIEGTYQAVAARMGLKYATVNSTMRDCRKKMGTTTMTRCAVLYALWRREMLGTSAEIVALLNPTKEKDSEIPS